jgi:hypothetical protein
LFSFLFLLSQPYAEALYKGLVKVSECTAVLAKILSDSDAGGTGRKKLPFTTPFAGEILIDVAGLDSFSALDTPVWFAGRDHAARVNLSPVALVKTTVTIVVTHVSPPESPPAG